jgi:hypothetical protein
VYCWRCQTDHRRRSEPAVLFQSLKLLLQTSLRRCLYHYQFGSEKLSKIRIALPASAAHLQRARPLSPLCRSSKFDLRQRLLCQRVR